MLTPCVLKPCPFCLGQRSTGPTSHSCPCFLGGLPIVLCCKLSTWVMGHSRPTWVARAVFIPLWVKPRQHRKVQVLLEAQSSSPKPLSTLLLLSAYSAWDLGRLAVIQMRHHFNTDASWLILARVPQGRVEMFAFEICREYLLMHFNKESSAQLGAVIGQPCLLQINKTGGYFCHSYQSGCC